jgi:hypothetical protein
MLMMSIVPIACDTVTVSGSMPGPKSRPRKATGAVSEACDKAT